MRASRAIFSLVLLKCGCKKLLAQLASQSEEQGGAQLWVTGGLLHCLLQPSAPGTDRALPASQPPGCWEGGEVFYPADSQSGLQ